MSRILTALVLLPLLWFTVFKTGPTAFLGISCVVLSVTTWECHRMFAARGDRPILAVCWLGVMAVLGAAAGFLPVNRGDVLVLTTLVTLACAMFSRAQPEQMARQILSTIFCVLYVGMLLSHIILLRGMPESLSRSLLVLLFICVICADAGAYYAGSAFGKRRLAPTLSPKKSWEGAIGGAVASVAIALGYRALLAPELPLVHVAILGAVLAIAAILGDLSESLFKRACGVKDSSNLLPGHGGTMDRLDSLMFAAPVLYYYSLAFLL